MITLMPIGVVRSSRSDLKDDAWDDVRSRIEIDDDFGPECLDGIEEFSHIEVVFFFDRVSENAVERGSRHPRGNRDWPRVGIFAQRGKDRPNRLGTTIVRLVGREGQTLIVEGLDAIEGTPVVDIKPVMAEFLPRSEFRQPQWSHELMSQYWR